MNKLRKINMLYAPLFWIGAHAAFYLALFPPKWFRNVPISQEGFAFLWLAMFALWVLALTDVVRLLIWRRKETKRSLLIPACITNIIGLACFGGLAGWLYLWGIFTQILFDF